MFDMYCTNTYVLFSGLFAQVHYSAYTYENYYILCCISRITSAVVARVQWHTHHHVCLCASRASSYDVPRLHSVPLMIDVGCVDAPRLLAPHGIMACWSSTCGQCPPRLPPLACLGTSQQWPAWSASTCCRTLPLGNAQQLMGLLTATKQYPHLRITHCHCAALEAWKSTHLHVHIGYATTVSDELVWMHLRCGFHAY